MKDYIRRMRLKPYRKHHGPTFGLVMWDTGGMDRHGKSILGYRLTSQRKTIFEGEDFGCSPLHAIDSLDAARSLLDFLTLQPGDTDTEYFDDYTPAQLEFANQHAEAISALYCTED